MIIDSFDDATECFPIKKARSLLSKDRNSNIHLHENLKSDIHVDITLRVLCWNDFPFSVFILQVSSLVPRHSNSACNLQYSTSDYHPISAVSCDLLWIIPYLFFSFKTNVLNSAFCSHLFPSSYYYLILYSSAFFWRLHSYAVVLGSGQSHEHY